ncbi:MAG: hypothetical protein WKG07_24995 [Hymenobacter sp.]
MMAGIVDRKLVYTPVHGHHQQEKAHQPELHAHGGNLLMRVISLSVLDAVKGLSISSG